MGLDIKSFALGVCVPPLAYLSIKLLESSQVKVDVKPHDTGLKVVITGSSKGIGFQLARQFLSLGDDVVITSRSQTSVENAVRNLLEEFPGCKVIGVVCDVSKPADVERLASTATEALGQIDIWINNAAQSASAKVNVEQTPATDLQEIVNINLTGALLGTKAAIGRMMTQHGGGKVFLVDGAGSRGSATPGNAAHGATKRALVQLCKSLAQEVKGSNVGVHIISPGMMPTELLLRHANTRRSAWFVNTFAEEAATVAAWLVPRIRGVQGNGVYIRYITPRSVVWRLLTAKRRQGRFVPDTDHPSKRAALQERNLKD